MEFITEFFNNFFANIQSNSISTGMLYVYLLGLCTFLLRNVPKAIYRAVKSQTVTSLVMNNTSKNDLNYQCFMNWFSKSKWTKFSRSMSLEESMLDSGASVVGVGFGTHFFMKDGWPYVFHKKKLESSGSNIEKEEIIIYTLGRKRERIINLIEDFKFKPNDNISIKIPSFSDWKFLASIEPRPLESVILNKDTKEYITNTLEHFFNNKEWYTSRGMPYKKTFVVHGEPGTGKSSIIKALASYYRKNIYTINLSMVNDNTFQELISQVKKGSFILIEDFDSAGVTHQRTSTNDTSSVLKNSKDSDNVTYGLTVTGLLNTLDGIVSLNDVVIFMTTNHLDKIDNALIRKGRVDHIIEVGKLTDSEIREYIKLMYPEYEIPSGIVFDDIKGCDIQSHFLEYREDVESFIKELPRKNYKIAFKNNNFQHS